MIFLLQMFLFSSAEILRHGVNIAADLKVESRVEALLLKL